MKKTICLLATLFLAFVSSYAQEEADKPHFEAGFYMSSSRVWRGCLSTSSPVMMPELSFNAGGFSAYLWGCSSVSQNYNEFDFGLSYSFPCGITVELADYFYPWCQGFAPDEPEEPCYNIFNYDNHTTGHQLDLMLKWEPENIPVHAMWSTIMFGDDKNDEDAREAYSSYLEAGVYHEWEEAGRIDFTAGACLWRSDSVYEVEKFSVINLDLNYSKTFDLGRVSIPLEVHGILNPVARSPYFVFCAGITF